MLAGPAEAPPTTASGSDPEVSVADPGVPPPATTETRVDRGRRDGAAAGGTTGTFHRAEPLGAGAASTDEFRLFGNGTAENPNAGILFGNGFSWDASSCTGGTACHGGDAGLWGGNGGNGFNGGNGGSAGWFGDGGNGGAGLPGGDGGDGGNGGSIFGTGGNGGNGGAALVAGSTPGRGGDGGTGGLFGTEGRAGVDGAAFPSQPEPPATPSSPPATPEPTPPPVSVASGLTFDFIYGTGAQHWSSAARDALEAAAQSLASYFSVASPVTLTYYVSGENSPRSGTLAWAASDLAGSGPGFLGTVAQEKILSGVDPNGGAADGEINFNFGFSWGLDSSVGSRQYDLQATAMHELLHTLGFMTYVDRAGSNSYRDWTIFDSFIVTSSDVNVIGSDFRWKSAYNPNLTGGAGGLYFGGSNAVAAYGGLVPLFAPNPWESGSSISHLDDDTFGNANIQMMNAYSPRGLGVRTLSPIELGILEDLGYTVVSPQGTYAALFIAIVFVRRRRQSDLADERAPAHR